MKTLRNVADRQEILHRLSVLSAEDAGQWGSMSVQQMVRHVHDAFRVALGDKTVHPVTGLLQRTVIKWGALYLPVRWPKGVPTLPELQQQKGVPVAGEFRQNVAALCTTVDRFCDKLPHPLLPHPIFGRMTQGDWMRWGFLHTDHHLRQFSR